MLESFLLLFLAIVVLYFGAEFALESAEKIGLSLGLSPLVIGLLIIGFGTSLPEFFVSQLASYQGRTGIALGNIIGSNLANVLLVLGFALFFEPLKTGSRDLFTQLVFHLALMILLFVIFIPQKITPLSAMILLAFFGVYLTNCYLDMRRRRTDRSKEAVFDTKTRVKLGSMLFLGFIMLFFGGELLVRSGSSLASEMGVSDYLISAIFIAFGTSFPELVTAIIAAYKKKNSDLIVGNVIGSNIFNISFVLGSLFPYEIPLEEGGLQVEVGLLLILAFFLFFMSLKKLVLTRMWSFIFLGIYISLVVYWV